MKKILVILSLAIIAFLSMWSTALASEGGSTHIVEPNSYMIIPFLVLLISIAVMPFINLHWWEKYFAHVSIGLGLITVVYYVFFLDNSIRMLHSGIEYFSFICLIGSLFVVAGGIHITLKGYASPIKNTIILLIGAVSANIIGTTGASMILIRPYLRNNKSRLHPYHIVFFIFIVSNIGGALTPIGDPPLFLGYLKGIPFFWVLENVWFIWLICIGMILLVFIATDWYFYMKMPDQVRQQQNLAGDITSFEGLHNLGFILIILVAVFITDPPFVREGIMIAASVASYFTTRQHVHEANDFNFFPIKEVGFLFLGLFATMVPALDWLELNAQSIGIDEPGQFYWATGLLSAFLDNAPTYLNFLHAQIGLFVSPKLVAQIQEIIAQGSAAQLHTYPLDVQQTFAVLQQYHGSLVASGSVPVDDINVSHLIGVHPLHVMAISVSAVFFGAMTYIGNAPNFMVKAIAEQNGAKMPSFFGFFFKFSIPILLPLFIVIWLLFFS